MHLAIVSFIAVASLLIGVDTSPVQIMKSRERMCQRLSPTMAAGRRHQTCVLCQVS